MPHLKTQVDYRAFSISSQIKGEISLFSLVISQYGADHSEICFVQYDQSLWPLYIVLTI